MKILRSLFSLLLALTIVISCVGCGRSDKPDTDKGETEDSKTDIIQPIGDAKIKIGVVSDPQLEADITNASASNYNGPEQFKAALQYYKSINCDVIFYMGDIVNNAQQKNYDLYNSIFNEVFPNKKPDEKPIIVFNLGNHERFTGLSNPMDDIEFTDKQFRNNTGEDIRSYKTVNGFAFITIESRSYSYGDGQSVTHTPEAINFLENSVKDAASKATDGRPIFVGIHEPIQNSVYGEGFTYQSVKINNRLKQYPNVILFSGHSHFPVADDRSIYQEDYTVVNTGSCSYCCIGTPKAGKRYNSADLELDNIVSYASAMPRNNDYSGIAANKQGIGLVVEVFENVTRIERRNFMTNKQIGSYWNIPFNPKKEDFFYTDARYKEDDVVTWNENHNVKVDFNGISATVTFDEAIKDKFEVESYKIDLLQFGTEHELSSTCIVGDYYAGRGPSKYRVKLSTQVMQQKAQIRITPFNCFGKAGEPFIADAVKTKKTN